MKHPEAAALPLSVADYARAYEQQGSCQPFIWLARKSRFLLQQVIPQLAKSSSRTLKTRRSWTKCNPRLIEASQYLVKLC
ncbi:hypothetical protein PI124_g10738 [Phytophthora idaei]|nr:hypothetical protein PI125_g10218 [Phytophthora idaei]KAG3244485.1 hypothetical protein PI124_g10738 [Phytophthora idaei]